MVLPTSAASCDSPGGVGAMSTAGRSRNDSASEAYVRSDCTSDRNVSSPPHDSSTNAARSDGSLSRADWVMGLTVLQRSITDWFISTPGCGVWNRVAAVYHTVLCLQKAPSDRKNCHVAEFRQRTHRAPPSVEPGRRIRPRPTGPASLCGAPPPRTALYAPGEA